MTVEPTLRYLARGLSQDRVFRLFFLVWTLFQLPYLLPGLSDPQLETYAFRYTNPFLLPAVILTCLAGLSRLRTRSEMELWGFLSMAFYFWWCYTLTSLFLSPVLRGPTFRLITDGLYGFFYICAFVAAALAIHRRIADPATRWVQCLRVIGGVLLVGSLIMYLFVVPDRVQTDDFVAWVSSLSLYVALDLTLAAIFAGVAFSCRGKWRWINGLLALMALSMGLLDTAEAMIYQGLIDGSDPRTNFFWNLPFLPLTIAARLRHLSWPETAADAVDVEAPAGIGSPLVAAVFVLPLIHFGGHQLQLFDPVFRSAREAVFLFGFLLAAILAVAENHLLRLQSYRVARSRRQLAELRIAQAVTQRTELDRIELLANVSHEIRTPMNGILGMTWLFLRSDVPEKAKRYASILETSARGLLRLFDDFLDYSRFESGTLELNPTPTDTLQVARQVVELFEPAAGEGDLELTATTPEQMPTFLVDSSRLRQVLVNLLSNAIKFTPRGGRVSLEVKHGGAGGAAEEVCFVVSDSGIGIHEKAQVDLFMPFNRGEIKSEERFGGTGLGLAVCKRIVDTMGGDISFSSQVGQGSTFRVRLPVERVVSPVIDMADPMRSRGASAEDGPRRILLVEDNEVNQLVAASQLESLGHIPIIACNGREALEALDSSSFDLVLMDCQMPEMDGYETVRRHRRREPSGVRVPIIAATAHAFESDRARCLEAGMDDFLAKPFDDQQLAHMLGRWLPKARVGQSRSIKEPELDVETDRPGAQPRLIPGQ